MNPKKPFPHPKPRRLSEQTRMTIVAGFKCTDGIVLCADSQETINSYLKVSVPKLVTRPHEFKAGDKYRTAFVGAGNGPFVDKLVESMWSASSAAGGDIDDISSAMEGANIAVHEKLWNIYPDNEKPQASIIFGVAASDDVKLFRSHGPIVNPIDTYDCAGCGDVLGKYICDRLYLPTMNVTQVSIVALYMLLHTKKYADGCGGTSHLVMLHKSLEQMILGPLSTEWVEKNLVHFDFISRDLLVALPDNTISEKDFDKKLRIFAKGVRAQRTTSMSKLNRHWKKIERQLEGLVAKRQ
jgi:hypothetical protein